MIKKLEITTPAAPKAIGTYSQAIQVGQMVFVSGQIPLCPETMQVVEGEIGSQIEQTFQNLLAVVKAAGGGSESIVKLTIYLTDLSHFSLVNEIMSAYFQPPYPARAVIGVSSLPKGVAIEMDAILIINE